MKNIKITNRKTKKSYFINQEEHDQMKEAGVLKRFTVEFNAAVKPAPGFRPKEIRNMSEERFNKNGEAKQEPSAEQKHQVKLSDEGELHA